MAKIVDKAIDVSLSLLDPSESKKVFHFSFIFLRNKILSVGQNYMDMESPKALRFAQKFGCAKTKKFPYIHSEVDSISRLWGRIRLTGRHRLVNIRLSRKGELRQSKPCSSCDEIIRAIGLKVVYFNEDLELIE